MMTWKTAQDKRIDELEADIDALALAYADIQVDRDKLQTELFNARQENHALAAKLALLDQAWHDSGRWPDTSAEMERIELLFQSDPQQCLAEIRAVAVESGLNAIGAPLTKFKNKEKGFSDGFNYCAELLKQYADKIRQGGAK